MNIKSHYTLSTRMPLEEIKRRLSDNVDPSLSASDAFWGVKSLNGKPFGGKISGDSFDIFKTFPRLNFHAPVLKGNFEYFLGRTELHITVQLSNTTLVLFGAAVFILLIPGFFIPYLAAPLLFKVVGVLWLLYHFYAVVSKFNLESMISEALLKELLEAQRIDD